MSSALKKKSLTESLVLAIALDRMRCGRMTIRLNRCTSSIFIDWLTVGCHRPGCSCFSWPGTGRFRWYFAFDSFLQKKVVSILLDDRIHLSGWLLVDDGLYIMYHVGNEYLMYLEYDLRLLFEWLDLMVFHEQCV